MPNYIQKQKDKLKWKIDHYFKDLDFGFSEIFQFCRYLELDLGISFTVVEPLFDGLERFDDFNKDCWNLTRPCVSTFIPGTSEILKDIKVDYLIAILHTLEDSLGNNDCSQVYLAAKWIVYKLSEQEVFIKTCIGFGNSEITKKGIVFGDQSDIVSERNEIAYKAVGYEFGKTRLCKIIYKKVILPIYEHIVNNLDERHNLEQLLERYKFRTEHFTKKNWEKKPKNEVKLLQPDLGLFLVDQGIDFTKESHSADNNRIDFLSGDFIIETKQLDIFSDDWKGVTQLMDYLNKENKRFGYLVVYLHNTKNEDEDKRFKFDKEIYTINEKVIKVVLIDIRIRKPKKEDKVSNELSTASQITSFINLTLDNNLTIIKA